MKLNDIVAVSGILLTLITFLFNLAWPKIEAVLEQSDTISGDKAKSRARKNVNKTLCTVVFPIFISFLSLFYVNLPTAVEIISTSRFSLWHFDVDDTLFIMVVLSLLSFVLFNTYLMFKLYQKQLKLK